MSDSSRSTSDSSAAAERLLGALGAAASGLGTRETLAELGDRARGIVEGLSRHARQRREAADAAATEAADESASRRSAAEAAFVRPGAADAASTLPFPQVHRRLDELRACVGEVADVLEATVERLETIEGQLGDPGASVHTLLRDGVERCERVLMGLEYSVLAETKRRGQAAAVEGVDARGPAEPARAPDRVTVLVVSRSSAQRARICVALERQGLAAVAATDLAVARRVCTRAKPGVALLAIDEGRDNLAALLEEWKEGEETGSLPLAALLDAGSAASAFEFPNIREQHGAAAMAASLVALAGRDGA